MLFERLMAEAILTPTETAVLWGLHHPYWLVAIAIALVIMLQLSLSTISQLLRRSLKWLGKSPFSLGRWIFTKTPLSTETEESLEQQLVVTLVKLENLQQQQATLLAELQSILKTREINQSD